MELSKKIEDMTPEEVAVLEGVMLKTFDAVKTTLASIMEALLRAGLIDEDGNLTPKAKELLEEGDNENNT